MSGIVSRCSRGVKACSLAFCKSSHPSLQARGFKTPAKYDPEQFSTRSTKIFFLASSCLIGAAFGAQSYDLLKTIDLEPDLKRPPKSDYGQKASSVQSQFHRFSFSIWVPFCDQKIGHNAEESEDDTVEARHAAEELETEQAYKEHLKMIEARYQHELKDAQAKASAFATRIQQLEKELEREAAKHLAELRSRTEIVAARLQEEIQSLKEEVNVNAKVEAGEQFAKERLRLVNEITKLKQQIESIDRDFSDLDRLGKLVMVMRMPQGIFAFENAMTNGAPLEKEVAYLGGGDALIDAAVSSLPEEAIRQGSWTPLQLQMNFVDSKQKLRELVLIPATGGGTVSHLIARTASNLKVKEDNNEKRGGVEAVLDAVHNYLKEGKLMEAADVLEKGMEGTEAESVAAEWVKQARIRAAIEQVHDVLRAHATTISISIA